MSSTSWKNHAPARVAAATAMIATAAVSTGAASTRDCVEFAKVPDVTIISPAAGPNPHVGGCRAGRDHTGVFCAYQVDELVGAALAAAIESAKACPCSALCGGTGASFRLTRTSRRNIAAGFVTSAKQ